MFSLKLLATVIAISAGGATVYAQHFDPAAQLPPRFEGSVSYSYLRANAGPGHCGCFSMNGGSGEVAVRIFHGLSGVIDLTGEHAGSTGSAGQSLSLVFVTAGPRFTFRVPHDHESRYAPFVQGLVGAAHGFDGQFPNGSGTLSSSATGLGALIGGGLDLLLSRHLAVRAFQVDYGLSHLPNNVNDSQNLLRVSAGLVFRVH
jgi:outer membrane immunogenic protein